MAAARGPWALARALACLQGGPCGPLPQPAAAMARLLIGWAAAGAPAAAAGHPRLAAAAAATLHHRRSLAAAAALRQAARGVNPTEDFELIAPDVGLARIDGCAAPAGTPGVSCPLRLRRRCPPGADLAALPLSAPAALRTGASP